MRLFFIIIGILLIGSLFALWYRKSTPFPLPAGETVALDTRSEKENATAPSGTTADPAVTQTSTSRTILVTDGTTHSIPLNEILDGGPGKDGIPSIDAPQFVSADTALFLESDDIGIGLSIGTQHRFYPYRILVWHEIVNDTVADMPVVVTYCPLCATGIVFQRIVDGEMQTFGVSGKLWQSNLLMYNRAETESDESLWSQVLGEAVLGTHTGKKLTIVRSDIVRFGDWKARHPDTVVLSQDTGVARQYGRDPYGDYYTSRSVSFGATFTDTRLHPKALVHGIAINGQYKAYPDDRLPHGTTITDTVAGVPVVVAKSAEGELTFTTDGTPLASIPGFWFSWLAVHPETLLFE